MSADAFVPIPWNESQAAAKAADEAGKSVTYTACIAVSISLKAIIPPHALVSILKGHVPVGDWEPYLGVFFGECPAKIIHGVVKENGLTMLDMEKCYQSLPKGYQAPHFKKILQNVFAE